MGTAGHYEGFVLVEWPLPWPRDPADVPELAGLAEMLRRRRMRLQLVSRLAAEPSNAVIVYTKHDQALSGPAAAFAGYSSRFSQLRGRDGNHIADVVRGMLSGEHDEPADHGADILMCSHGTRDRCCGSRGARLALEVASQGWAAEAGYRLWRTSHLGGHHFAPTALVLPQGSALGLTTAEVIRSFAERKAMPDSGILGSYRGSTGLESSAGQVLEAAVLAETGWSLLDQPRWAVADADHVELFVHGRDAVEPIVWRARITPGRSLLMPPCGSEQPGSKSTQEFELSDLSVRRPASSAQTRPTAAAEPDATPGKGR